MKNVNIVIPMIVYPKKFFPNDINLGEQNEFILQVTPLIFGPWFDHVFPVPSPTQV
jgi:hypothetical protein